MPAPSEYGHADPGLVAMAVDALKSKGLAVVVGSSWTTDAPFRETAEAIEAARAPCSLLQFIFARGQDAARPFSRGGFVMALSKTTICDFGWKARDFALKGVDGKTYTLADARGPKGTLVVFIKSSCRTNFNESGAVTTPTD